MRFNKADTKPLLDDGYAGEPAKRCLQYILDRKEQGAPVAGIYCGYAPLEIVHALGAVPAVLCAFADKTIPPAEEVLPSNLCPLIKSSYGFVLTGTCPFFGVSDVVVAETTCDGKKKMFEFLAREKPMWVMDLPQLPDQPEAVGNWAAMIRRLQGFLEERFGRSLETRELERAIAGTNRRNALMRRFFSYAALYPPAMSWSEVYDVSYLAQVAAADFAVPVIESAIRTLEERIRRGIHYGDKKAVRVLVTGCPVGGDATKVYRIIEESGGVLVAIDSCTGMKAYREDIPEGNGDPWKALARRYLNIPCSCMTPNGRRLVELDRMIAEFRPDAVIDIVLHACHSYNIESANVSQHLRERHGLPFLKIETDYSTADVEQIRNRVEALMETIGT